MPQPISADDILQIKTISDPQMSPDGTRVAFVVKRVDAEQNKYFTNVWIADADGSSTRQFTFGDFGDTEPRWSPDGTRLAFQRGPMDTGKKGTHGQVYIIPVGGGEARKLTNVPEGSISHLAWAPDGTRIAFVFEKTDERETQAAKDEREKGHKSTPPRVITRLHYREEGTGWLGQERGHVWTADAETGEAKQITFHANGEGAPVWSPDGATIAFTANRKPDPDADPLFESIILVAGEGGEERVVSTPDGPKGDLAWSPDGSRIAYTGHTDMDDTWGTRNINVWSVSANGGDAVNHTSGFDRPVGDFTLGDVHSFGAGESGPIWQGSSILFLASDSGTSGLYSVSTADNLVTPLISGKREVAAVTADSDSGKFALVIGTVTTFGEVFVWDGSGESRQVSNLNGDFLASRTIATPEEFTIPSYDGADLHGWILKPVDFDAFKQYPMILQIHGGPHTQYGWGFFHEFQYLAAQGFVVVYTNPRGSQGYGEAWTRSIKGKWGEPDLGDLMAAVDHVLSLGYVDEKRLGVTGGSYGGFMTGWVVGHTNRFQAAIADRGVFNLVSMAGVSDYTWDDKYYEGFAWEWSDALRKYSPLTYAANVTTPIMILHSEGDLRCPVEQSEQYYHALRRLGKEVTFVRFPAESNHGLSRGGPPDLRLKRLSYNLEWMKKYLGAGPTELESSAS